MSWKHRLRYASKADKEAGVLKRAREKETFMAQLERDQMAYEDEARGPLFCGELFHRIQRSDRFGTIPRTLALDVCGENLVPQNVRTQ